MEDSKIKLEELTVAELAQLEAQLEARKKDALKKIQDDRETYKKLVNENVNDLWDKLERVSDLMTATKSLVFSSFEKALELKKEAYSVKDDQQSHTFTTEDGKRSITIGHRLVDRYDETVTAGISKVKEYVKSLAKDDDSAALVETILGLLKPNKDGVLKASRVLELKKLANKVNNADFTDGLRIIEEAYRPAKTCQFVSVKYKDDNGVEKTLPLSMSAIDY
jgi:hypothetical protein